MSEPLVTLLSAMARPTPRRESCITTFAEAGANMRPRTRRSSSRPVAAVDRQNRGVIAESLTLSS